MLHVYVIYFKFIEQMNSTSRSGLLAAYVFLLSAKKAGVAWIVTIWNHVLVTLLIMLYEVSKDFFFFNVVNQTLFPSFDMPAGYQQPKKSARLKNYAKPNICLEMCCFSLFLLQHLHFYVKQRVGRWKQLKRLAFFIFKHVDEVAW